jgi:hypothetical protein
MIALMPLRVRTRRWLMVPAASLAAATIRIGIKVGVETRFQVGAAARGLAHANGTRLAIQLRLMTAMLACRPGPGFHVIARLAAGTLEGSALAECARRQIKRTRKD